MKSHLMHIAVLLFYLTNKSKGNISSIEISYKEVIKKDILKSVVFLTRANVIHPRCSGTIIDPKWVLTAAHCVSYFSPDQVRVVAGTEDLENKDDLQVRTASRIILHPSYPPKAHPSLGFYDYALVEVSPAFIVGNGSATVMQLQEKGWPKETSIQCIIAGWGDSPVLERQRLHFAVVTAVHGPRSCPCAKDYVLDRVVCLQPIATDPALGICSGDSGGPLVCGDRQVGLAHMMFSKHRCNLLYTGSSRTRCGWVGMVSTFMYICPQLSWVRNNVGYNIPKQPSNC